MHPTTAQPTRLLPRQTRLIHASTGVRLRVVSGRLWLTQPNVAQDLFLGPGASIDLLQDWVVIGADAEPRSPVGSPDSYSEYQLVPLVQPASRPSAWVVLWRRGARLGRWVRASASFASAGAR
ncbi:DUF2917 domain-containing protein [Hydrogenophaga aromaticivorans]|nr:DUF2917 domain-containing protein [Hydrogenophaga aromaticivorans]